MRRNIITIDHEKCDGCGLCANSCPEGALRLIDGKARLVGDLLCDGLGACLSSCPQNAITVEEREAEAYNENMVMKNIVTQGSNVILAHLQHLKNHYQTDYLKQAIAYLRAQNIAFDLPPEFEMTESPAAECPGSRAHSFARREQSQPAEEISRLQSHLTHWPVQLHLISPLADHFHNSDLLIAADCVAYALAGFHREYLKGRTLAIACPKLDSRQEIYVDKLTALIDQAEIKSIRVMIMQVPCCSGLLRQVVEAASRAKRQIPVRCVVVGIQGDILNEAPVTIESRAASA